jgi:hypothetical protein
LPDKGQVAHGSGGFIKAAPLKIEGFFCRRDISRPINPASAASDGAYNQFETKPNVNEKWEGKP